MSITYQTESRSLLGEYTSHINNGIIEGMNDHRGYIPDVCVQWLSWGPTHVLAWLIRIGQGLYMI